MKKTTTPKPTTKKTSVKKSSAQETKKQEAPQSNKATIFVRWQKDGNPDTSEDLLKAYLKLVKGAVKEQTVKGWLGEWRRGQNFPKGHTA